jgi:hypothetical protein
MRSIFTTVIVAVVAATLGLGTARAEDKKKDEPAKKAGAVGKGDPSGTWHWSSSGQNGQSFEQTATFKREGDKLSGTVTGRRGDSPISDGTFKDGKVIFSVIRERNGQKMTAKYEGKVEGDAIKGTSTMNRGDGEHTNPWEAKKGPAPTPTPTATPTPTPAPTPTPTPAK